METLTEDFPSSSADISKLEEIAKELRSCPVRLVTSGRRFIQQADMLLNDTQQRFLMFNDLLIIGAPIADSKSGCTVSKVISLLEARVEDPEKGKGMKTSTHSAQTTCFNCTSMKTTNI